MHATFFWIPTFLDSHFRGTDTLGLPSEIEVGCSVRLKWYLFRLAFLG